MTSRSLLLDCLEDCEGFSMNEPNEDCQCLSPVLIRRFLDILVKYGRHEIGGHPCLKFDSSIVSMYYYFGDNDCVQKNPSFSITINGPHLFTVGKHYSCFLDNGIYFSFENNSLINADLWEVVYQIDKWAEMKNTKENTLLSQTRFPVLRYCNMNPEYFLRKKERDDELSEKYNKCYHSLTAELDLRGFSLYRGEKAKFLKEVSEDSKGFESGEQENFPNGISPELLRDLWVFGVRYGSFIFANNQDNSSLYLPFGPFELSLQLSHNAWDNNILVKNSKQNKKISSTESFDFALQNGLKVSWNKKISAAWVRAFINDFIKEAWLKTAYEGIIIPLLFMKAEPILLDESLRSRNLVNDLVSKKEVTQNC